jgi:CPA2 family monovalent cation:H+ antiporter-2
MFRLIDPTERLLRRAPPLWRLMDRHGVIEPPKPAEMSDHVVIVGSGRVGRHIAEMLGRQEVPRLVVESNPFVLAKLRQMKVPTLFGDAANSEILEHARLDAARLLVITVPDDVSAMMMVEAARRIAPTLRILARASSWDGGRRLLAHGASQIVRPELEGGVELLRQTLRDLSYPDDRAQEIVDLAREEAMADQR